MPTPVTSDLPKPKSWDELEDILWKIYSKKWQDPHAQRYGRSGQAQHGVDIYGQTDGAGAYIGVQCKRYENGKLTAAIVEEEISKAEGFSSPLTEYIIATTASRDVDLQDFVRHLNEGRQAQGKFPVRIVFWEDISAFLVEPNNRDLLVEYYAEWKDLFQADESKEKDIYLRSYSDILIPQVQLFKGREKELELISKIPGNSV